MNLDYLTEIEKKNIYFKQMPANSIEEKVAKDSYYYNEIFPLIRQYFSMVERSKIQGEYAALILSVGKSFEPLVLSIEAIQPERVYFLYTEETENNIDNIVELTGLKPSQFQKEEVDSIDPTQIYETIKKIASKVNTGKIAVDFTGGTKSMSGGMAMAGGIIGADLIYISSRWLDRRAEPGSERLEMLANPYDVFGEIEINRAFKLWDEGEYYASAEIFEQLAKRLPEHFEYSVLANLAKAFYNWEAINMNQAADHFEWILGEGRKNLGRMQKRIISEVEFKKIAIQYSIVKNLGRHLGEKTLPIDALADTTFMTQLILSFYTTGIRRESQNKLDVAALYLYRMIEMIFQHRIAIRGIMTDKPDYSKIDLTQEDIIKKVNGELKKQKLSLWSSLPEQLSLANTHVLLTALGDPVALTVHPSKLRNASEARNYSILAHGFLMITNKEYEKIKEIALELLRSFIEALEKAILELQEDYLFLRPRVG